MISNLHSIWTQTLEKLEQHISQATFERWLRKTKPTAFYEDTLVVTVQNEFAKDRLEARYANLIRQLLREVTQRNVTLQFVVQGEAYNTSNTEYFSDAPEQNLFRPLNPKYTFDTFVVGNSNRLAHAATQAVAETPAKSYNPLFIYGGVGLGKTHLMHAIGHHVQMNNPSTVIAYISTETFTNEFINCIRDDKMPDFQTRYRNVDVLLIDDIQFLAKKVQTQEEFFHTFNAIHEADKQIVISSDRPPKEIPTLEERLRSRFEWGLLCDIQPPDLETRIAILRKKASHERLEIPDDVIGYIATNIDSNIRELEGALNRIIACSDLGREQISLPLAVAALKEILPPTRPKQITIQHIQEIVAAYYNIRTEDLKVRKRTRNVVFPRQIAMFLARQHTDSSLPKIGEEFGGRDHSTVIHACDKIAEDIRQDPALGATVEHLVQRIRAD